MLDKIDEKSSRYLKFSIKAQFRELEAFAKFGFRNLDAATDWMLFEKGLEQRWKFLSQAADDPFLRGWRSTGGLITMPGSKKHLLNE